jgi:chitinase
MKTRFLKIVDPKKYRESRAFSLDAYDTSKPADHRPDRYSIDSPYQQLVDPREFEEQVIRESNSEQKEDNKPIPSRLKAINNDLKVVCFVTNWSFYRKKDGKYVPENLNPKLCTHIIFVYAKLDPDLLELIEFDKWTDLENQLYSRTVGLDRDVSVLLGIGGWTDSVGDKYTRLVSNARNRKNFIQKAISFLREHRFKGLHFDWNYPICWQSDCKAGQATDKDYFSIFMEEMSREFKKYNLILSTSISGYKEIIAKSYDMKSLSRSVDFFTVMTYDYHGSWETKTGHVSPLYGSNDDTYPQYNTDFAMQYLVNLGADKEKLIMGIPFYGQSFTLSKQKSNQAFNSVALGPGMAGEFTLQPGMLSYSEICDNIRTKQWVKGFDQSKKSGPYASDGKQWVGYDDVEMVRIKTRYAANEGFGGVAAWTVDLDDFNNRCCFESSPLLKAINREIGRLTSRVPSGQDCTPEKMPVTPTPPTMATTLESGQAGIPSASSSTPGSYFTSPKPTTTSSTTTTMRTTTSSVSRPTVPQPINVMPSSCEEGTFQPDPSNCGAYYICSNNNLVQSQCPNNLHWNNGAKSCDWPANAQCEIRETQPAETSTTKKRRKKTTTSTTTEATTTTTTTTTRKPKTTTTTTTTRKPPTTTPYLITTMSTRKTTKIKEQPTTMSYETYPTTTERQTTRSKSTPRPDYYTSIILMTQLDSRTSTTKRPSGAKRPPCVNGQYYPHKTCEK